MFGLIRSSCKTLFGLKYLSRSYVGRTGEEVDGLSAPTPVDLWCAGGRLTGAGGIPSSKRNCVGCAGGVGAYVAYTMGAVRPPPAPSRTRTDTLTVWRIPDDPLLFFFGAAFFGFFGFFFGGMAVLY